MSAGVETKPQSFVGVCGKPGEGPHMILVLQVLADRVVQSRYSTYGCTVAQTCGQWVCDEIEGKPLSYAMTLDENAVIRGVGHMPLGREHCPGLAIEALRHALGQVPSDGESKRYSVTDGRGRV